MLKKVKSFLNASFLLKQLVFDSLYIMFDKNKLTLGNF